MRAKVIQPKRVVSSVIDPTLMPEKSLAESWVTLSYSSLITNIREIKPLAPIQKNTTGIRSRRPVVAGELTDSIVTDHLYGWGRIHHIKGLLDTSNGKDMSTETPAIKGRDHTSDGRDMLTDTLFVKGRYQRPYGKGVSTGVASVKGLYPIPYGGRVVTEAPYLSPAKSALPKPTWIGAWLSKRRHVEIRKQKERLTGPIQFLKKLLGTWRLESEDAVCLLGLQPSDMDYVTDLLNGRVVLKEREVEDRLVCLFRIRMMLFTLFRNEEVENEWLRESRSVFDGQTPLERMLDGSTESLFLVKDYIESAGR